MNKPSQPLLNVQNLNISINDKITLLNNISFSLNDGDCLAIIGESGSGKTSLSKALLGLCQPELNISGQVYYQQKNLLDIKRNHSDWSLIRGKQIALIPQNSSNVFNPLLSIRHQVYEILNQNKKYHVQQLEHLIEKTFTAVSLYNCQQLLNKYPYELSGGTLQRISIALAFMQKPEIIIADEPTSNIDWLSKRNVLSLFELAVTKYKQSLLIITHDFGDITKLANHIIILKDGIIVEQGLTTQILNHPIHPYTKSLIEARHKLDDHFQQIIHPQINHQGDR